ncbi:hypothetical protein TWF106_004309 [Orbilia oligospora]|uniref:NAD-dependent epimerase/dehydratase domain-containing protein n=1 Tax=Orbilia oligospora TaxID=2813651 RepID=A0A6G1MN49_ORBOL|nr:hypothetical protein TWF788_003272 [Orbilia oligospora]KAF3216270.1 hypothetical protein TWF191_009097 [Orbilia oligospora]KAF3216813.1 hypothetical protein TWF679_002657 [Orbilia oligospora]KAF3229390.1 hypothetical protein TWF106_004309 [Orbilia oligospora]KAF3264421.1 hypothetical protein TWF192_004105 [Orbilia oligospora]
MTDGKPSVLIIGGLGYIGRWLAHHIHTNQLASEIRIVDKGIPPLAGLAPEFEEACKNFVQADMSHPDSMKRVFDRADGSSYDYVFNCAGETRYGQTDETYKQRNFDLPVACGKEAAKRGVKLFVELSEGRVYGNGPKGKKESDEIKPWLLLAKYKSDAERELQKVEGLNLVILRLANAYGPYSTKIIATAMCNARVHQFLKEKLDLLWTKDLRVNTVHVSDVSRAIWHAADWYVKGKEGWQTEPEGTAPIFNIVDDGDTSQGTVAEIVEQVFNIKTSFMGTLVSQLAKLNLDEAVDEANETVLQPWSDLLEDAGIKNSPISPFIEREQLQDSDLSLDGTRFKTITGFEYEVPKITTEKVEEMLASYKKMNWWP